MKDAYKLSVGWLVALLKHCWVGLRAGRHSLVYLLGTTIPIDALERIIADTSDWRSLTTRAAAELGISEMALTQQLARRAGMPFARQVPQLSGEFAQQELHEIDRWYAAAAVPVVHEGIVAGIACVDPARIQPLHLQTGGNIFLACWSEIKGVLDAAVGYEGDPFCTVGGDSAAVLTAIGLLLNEAMQYDAQVLSLQWSEAEGWCYQFRTSEGRTGRGTIARRVQSKLREWLEKVARSGDCEVDVGRTRVFVAVGQTGETSVFYLRWRLTDTEVPAADLPAPAQSVLGPPGPDLNYQNTGSAPILVVEDNSSFARVLAGFFKRYKLEATFARNGATALELLRADLHPALIVCDVHMPGIHGVQLLEILRSELCWQSIPVIMLTSDEAVETELHAIALGVTAFRHKHEDPRLLIAHIKQILESSVEQIELRSPARAA